MFSFQVVIVKGRIFANDVINALITFLKSTLKGFAAKEKVVGLTIAIIAMKIKGVSTVNETLAKIIFLVLPTICVLYFLLVNANNYFSILRNEALSQSVYCLLGMSLSVLFYAFRFRVLVTFAALVTVFYTIYKGLDATAIGEFDTFFLSVRFLIFSTLFSASWLLGAAFARWRYAHYLIAAIFLVASILLIAKQRTETVTHLLQSFLPAVLYSFYIVFAAEQIFNYKDKSQRFWWFMSRRVFLFLLLIISIGAIVTYQMQGQFDEAVSNAAGHGDKAENGMLKTNKDGNFDLKDYSQLRSNQGRNNELLFAAHIDNFLPGTEIPNPLYLTAFYYTKFDTSTETFERDAQIPKNDLFEPNVSQIPLYSTRVDSTVISNGMGDQGRRVVELEVYNKKLSPETYLAPNIGFFVQPIAIEKDFRGAFKSAYRAKAYVSELNSAYFIYNAKDPEIKAFQEQRFKVLRIAGSYENIDRRFMDYYTQMPKDQKFQRISILSQKIAAQAKTPVDKVLAIRDYFLSQDEDGKPLFSYTDNPGVPDIPSASKLMYFLFDNHKGYCAYYAGATLFMLRSLGIPSRITVGFMTIDRSDQNKGWYWYYADQAHAWVQVYFPGLGWLDFDTTVGNDDAQESPKPDGTPPMQPPHAWFASEGQIVAIDTLKRTIKLKVAQILFHDKEFKSIKGTTDILLDVSLASIQKDSINIDLKQVKVGDSATAVSYADAIKKMQKGSSNESAESIITKMATPAPMDDIYLKKTKKEIKEEQMLQLQHDFPFSWRDFLMQMFSIALILLLLFFSIPTVLFNYFKIRSKRAKPLEQKAYWQYRAFSFYMHQLGYFRLSITPLDYAKNVVDVRFGTSFTNFMNVYLKIKYTGQKISGVEEPEIALFLDHNLKMIQSKTTFKGRLFSFLRPLRILTFFNKPETLQGY